MADFKKTSRQNFKRIIYDLIEHYIYDELKNITSDFLTQNGQILSNVIFEHDGDHIFFIENNKLTSRRSCPDYPKYAQYTNGSPTLTGPNPHNIAHNFAKY